MSRRVRGLEFFSSDQEMRTLLLRWKEQGYHLYGYDNDVLYRADEELPSSHMGLFCVGLSDAPRRLPDSVAPRYGLVRLDWPQAQGVGKVLLSIRLSASNVVLDGGVVSFDDSSLVFFARLKRQLMKTFVGKVEVRTDGSTKRSPDSHMKMTAGAIELWREGFTLRQDLRGLNEYLPVIESQ